MLALDPQSPFLAVEQPELHLHPKVACNLADLFISQVANGKLFLIETHSEHLVLRIMRRIRETSADQNPKKSASIEPDDIAILFVESLEARTVVRVMPMNARGELVKAWPGGFFEEDLNELF